MRRIKIASKFPPLESINAASFPERVLPKTGYLADELSSLQMRLF